MKRLGNLKNTINEICLKLSQDQKLIRLLVDDSLNLDTELDFTFYNLENLLSQHYFCTFPIMESGIKESTRNTFLVIKISGISFSQSDSTTTLMGNIYIATDMNHYLLANNKDRALEICDRICIDLDGFKTTASQDIEIENITDIIIDNDKAGYLLNFRVKDLRSESEIEI